MKKTSDPRHDQAAGRVESAAGYRFAQKKFLEQALTHRSFSSGNNERFEFVGDSILNYTVARMLFDAFPELPEGDLSRLRANLVNRDTLAEVAGELCIGDALRLGAGELKSGGFRRPSILADAVEALFAAVSFDSGFAAAENVVRRLFAARVAAIDPHKSGKDAKTRLQEALQAVRMELPKYRIIRQSGDAHDQEFVVECDLGEAGFRTEAAAHSRREAEQTAAAEALDWLAKHKKIPKKP